LVDASTAREGSEMGNRRSSGVHLAVWLFFAQGCLPPPEEDEPPIVLSDAGLAAEPDAVVEPPSLPSDPPVAPAEPEARVVLLIPGTTITGDFFDDMAARLRDDGYEPYVYEPPDLFTGSLAEGAEGIARVVDALKAERGVSRVDIVAECNGGVATRYYLQVLGGHTSVDRVVTFVSAHHGTWLSPVGSWVSGFRALEDITPGSDFLAALDAAPFPSGLELTSIYSCNDEFMLPYDTSVVDGATNVLFCDYYLKHFDGFWDPVVYGRITDALEGRSAPTYY
jgi:triacylglycerol lipase